MQANMIQIQANARKDLRIQADTTCEYNKYKQIQAQIHYLFLHGQKGPRKKKWRPRKKK